MKRPTPEQLPSHLIGPVASRIPPNWPVQPTYADAKIDGLATCGSCGLSWNDRTPTSLTPAPSGRCPFETFHDDPTIYTDQSGQRYRIVWDSDGTQQIENVIDTRPILDLTYTSGRLCIGVTELDSEGNGTRSFVLVTQDEHTADKVMLRRFDDMARLMGDNVQIRRDLWATEDEAADEADARNADDNFDTQVWQTAYINVGPTGQGYWTVTLVNTEQED